MRLLPEIASMTLLAAAGFLSATATSAVADDWPTLRPGLWEFTRAVHSSRTPGRPQVIKRTRCIDPVADMKQQHARQARAGCGFSPMIHRGNTYTFSSECRIAGIRARSMSVLTVESTTAYRLHVETNQDGVQGKEDMIARRVGECRK